MRNRGSGLGNIFCIWVLGPFAKYLRYLQDYMALKRVEFVVRGAIGSILQYGVFFRFTWSLRYHRGPAKTIYT